MINVMYRVEKVMFTCKERDILYTRDTTLRHVIKASCVFDLICPTQLVDGSIGGIVSCSEYRSYF